MKAETWKRQYYLVSQGQIKTKTDKQQCEYIQWEGER